jgi:hypothetical protein
MPVNTNALQLKSATTVTIAAGVLIPTQALTIVAAQSGTTDDLDTISLTGFTSLTDSTNTFRPMVILLADSGDTITVKDGTGNIQLNANADFSLTGNAQLLLIYNGTNWTDVSAGGGGGSGTVTSVGVSTDASYLTVGSSPVTTAGTITLNKTTALTANQVVATPNGAPGTADLRALVAADIPNLPASQITSGQLALARGGTNADLSATGGTANFLKQSSVGANITVGTIANSDLPTSGVSAASYTNANITVNAQGIITTASNGSGATYNYARLASDAASGTAATATTGGAWTTYTLNTEEVDAGNIVSIASNQFTLANAGTYRILASTTFLSALTNVMNVRTRLQNITDGTTAFQGIQVTTPTPGVSATRFGATLPLQGVVTIAASKAFAVQYYTNVAGLTASAVTTGAVEVYMTIVIEQIA